MTRREIQDAEKFPHRPIGRRLEALRGTTGMNAREFADFMGLNYTRYINWESGYRRLLPDDAIQFCERFGVTLDFIYRGIEAQLPHSLVIELSSRLRQSAHKMSKDTPD